MIVTRTVTILTPERLIELGQALFMVQQTGDSWVCEPSIDDLAATILERRERLREVIASTPDASFDPQTADDVGNPVWTAGQCADHIVNAQYGVCEPAIIALITPGGVASFEQPLPSDDVPTPPMLERISALERLDRATLDYERLLDAIPRTADLSVTISEHRYFGAINLKAILLIAAWHEQSHAAQIARLAT